VADMLIVATGQFGHPMAFVVTMIVDDRLLHGRVSPGPLLPSARFSNAQDGFRKRRLLGGEPVVAVFPTVVLGDSNFNPGLPACRR
jgi:hypothetical protein